MRLEIQGDGSELVVTLSERNLLALLAKLHEPKSRARLSTINAFHDGEPVWDVTLTLRAETDEEHYQGRPDPPGDLQPQTEAAVARLRQALAEPTDQANGDEAAPAAGSHSSAEAAAPHTATGHKQDRDAVSGLVNAETQLRARRHAAGQLHAWVFMQHQVWVDAHGVEHEIETMPLDYVENVIAFAHRNATRIVALVAQLGTDERAIELDTWRQEATCDAIDEALAHAHWQLIDLHDHEQLHDLHVEARRWLEQTAVLVALERRRATLRARKRRT